MKCLFPTRLLAACAIAVSCLTAPAFGAVDMFLEIDGIEGESRLSPGAVDVENYSYSVKSPRDSASGQATGKRQHSPTTSGAGGGGGAGKVSMNDFHFTMRMNKATPKLMLACAQGQHIKEAKLTCRKTGGDGTPFTYLKVTMSDILVSSFSSGDVSGSDSLPMEEISFNFSKITFEFNFGTERVVVELPAVQ